MGALAALDGLIEFLTMHRVRSLAAGWIHFLGNAAATLIALWNFLYQLGGDPGVTIVPYGIILSAVLVAFFFVTGWPGGELVFGHRIGIMNNTSDLGD